jgi:hypothetical protein
MIALCSIGWYSTTAFCSIAFCLLAAYGLCFLTISKPDNLKTGIAQQQLT